MTAQAVRVRIDDVSDPQVQASLWWGETQIGSFLFAEWPVMIACYDLTVEPGPWEEQAGEAALSFMAQRWIHGDPPATFVHVGLRQPWMVRLYQRSPLAKGAVLTGTIGLNTLYHDQLSTLDEAVLVAAEEASTLGSTGLVLTYARDLELLHGLKTLSREQLVTLLQSETPSARIGALRALAKAHDVTQERRDQAFMFALLDPSYEVRRFASISLGGFFPSVPYAPDIEVLLEHVARPLQSLKALGVAPMMPEGMRWHEGHGRRNKRYGILWVLGALSGLSHPTETVTRWQTKAAACIEAVLSAQVPAHTASRDVALATLAAEELVEGAGRYGLGLVPDLGLFELLRYAVIRYGLVARLSNPDEDRFYWLMEMVDLIWPSPHSPRSGWEASDRPAPSVVEAALFAPVPEVALEVTALPNWLKGRWSNEAVQLV